MPGVRARLELVAVPVRTPRSAVLSSSATFDVPLVLAPRPVVFVHGMWSDATWWSAYLGGSGFLAGADPTWAGAAVNTMDTGTPLWPYAAVKTVSENAALAWSFIRGQMTARNAHEVDVVGHSLGGVIIRRMLHDPGTGAEARAAIRAVVLLGTPNGGSDCSTAWPVPANSELTFAEMDTFNLAYPGYPGTFTTSLYADHIAFTCFRASSGDLFVPAWSTRAQSVDAVQRISPGVQHASLPSSSAVFSGYVRPALALAAAPVSGGPTTALANPSAATTKLDDGTTTGTSLSVTSSVTLSPGQTLVASVVAPGGSTGALTYPSGAGTASVPLDRIGEFPVIQGEASYATLGGTTGPHTVSVTITASTPSASELRWDLIARN